MWVLFVVAALVVLLMLAVGLAGLIVFCLNCENWRNHK